MESIYRQVRYYADRYDGDERLVHRSLINIR